MKPGGLEAILDLVAMAVFLCLVGFACLFLLLFSKTLAGIIKPPFTPVDWTTLERGRKDIAEVYRLMGYVLSVAWLALLVTFLVKLWRWAFH